MKQKTAEQFRKEHAEEIQAVSAAIDELVPKLTQIREQFPNVGFMLHFGIWDPAQHWVVRHIDIEKQLAAEIFRDELQEEDELRQWVIEHMFENVGGGYIEHFDLSESAKVQK